MSAYYSIILFIAGGIGIFSCTQANIASPKPRQYPKVEFPAKAYVPFQNPDCNFSFLMPGYALIKKEQSFFEEKPAHPCWFDIEIPSLNGSLHCSYYPVGKEYSLDGLIQDAYTLVAKHNIKANYRDDFPIKKGENVQGMLFEVRGPVASPLQLYLTDSVSHFFRASLYFNNTVQPDSMAPVYEFIKADVSKLIDTFEWN